MRRNRKSGALGLWMNGQRVGSWVVSAQGEHQLHYDETWLASPLGRPISLSMPLRPGLRRRPADPARWRNTASHRGHSVRAAFRRTGGRTSGRHADSPCLYAGRRQPPDFDCRRAGKDGPPLALGELVPPARCQADDPYFQTADGADAGWHRFVNFRRERAYHLSGFGPLEELGQRQCADSAPQQETEAAFEPG